MSKSAKARSVPRRRRKSSPPGNPRGAESHEYTQADLIRVFRLPAALIRSLSVAGFITASARTGKTKYSFQDLLVLRMASALKAAKVPAARIMAAFATMRTLLPPGAALSSLAVAATGKNVAVREGSGTWETHSGQYALPLNDAQPAPRGAPTAMPLVSIAESSRAQQAELLYAQGHDLEATDLAAARATYLEALRICSSHLEARINLGRLLHLGGELQEAERVYRKAQSSSALLSFNLAILLEDLQREEEAIATYREALALDPSLHDAHFNLARLHEKANRPRDALRHLLAYRRHVVRIDE
jgi:tetratricopeptide (TPR) repeat protein